MRFLISAIALIAVLYMIKSDLTEGTIQLAAFASETSDCQQQDKPVSIVVTTTEGDSIESLFALYPDPETTFIDRLTEFYELNPHLQKQNIVAGEQIELPIHDETVTICGKK